MIPHDNSSRSRAAFTRTELLFIIFATIIIICLATPPIIKARRQKDLARCKANLQQVGLALILWIDDNDELSLQAFFQRAHPRRNELWFHMTSLSNHLRSPQLLVCPADKQARIAKTWDTNAGSGLGAGDYRDRACSYAVTLDGLMSGTGPLPLEACINSIVFVDRHLGGKSTPEQCKSTQIASTGFQKPFDLWWKPELHGASEGNVTFLDGSVQTASKSVVKSAFPIDLQSQDWAHVLFPKRPDKR